MFEESIVHVIDDDAAVRDSLTFLLRAAKMRVRAHESATDFVKLLPNVEAGCVITDIRMPGMTGIELLEVLKEKKVALPVVVITGHGDVPLAVEAMKSGASDFLEKPFDDEAILTAVKSALSRPVSVSAHSAGPEIMRKLEALSKREREVLEGLVAGLPNKSIAFDLGISARTVEVYRANLMTKMGANSFSDLVRMALLGGVSNTGKPK
jgi:two-component system response regulator FixJ